MLSSTKLLNSCSRLVPLSKYNDELFFKFSFPIIDKVNSVSEYSFVLSVAPIRIIPELLIFSISVLWIDVIFLGFSSEPNFVMLMLLVPDELEAFPLPNIEPLISISEKLVASRLTVIDLVTLINE